MNTFKTKKGTELPLMDIKGQHYLKPAYRLVWFREEHPDWGIETDFHSLGEGWCIMKATIRNEKGQVMATAHKVENRKDFADFVEKAETGALGRALAMVGYGTQFTEDFDEGPRIVDSPLPQKKSSAIKTVSQVKVAAPVSGEKSAPKKANPFVEEAPFPSDADYFGGITGVKE